MTANREIGTAVVLVAAIVAAIGVVVGFLSITSAVGLAVCGIFLGTGVARGSFSNTPKAR